MQPTGSLVPLIPDSSPPAGNVTAPERARGAARRPGLVSAARRPYRAGRIVKVAHGGRYPTADWTSNFHPTEQGLGYRLLAGTACAFDFRRTGYL